jgi:hypothetical protein
MPERQDLEDRIKRAWSWIEAGGQLRRQNDHRHAEFVTLYVAFNSLYGRRQYEGTATQVHEDLERFLNRVRLMRERDEAEQGTILSKAILSCRDESLRLLASPFHRDDYWKRRVDLQIVRERCTADVRRARAALGEGRYEEFLRPLLWRLTVLRNQVVHGCVSYGQSSRGFEGLMDGLVIMRALVPAFHRLAKERGSELQTGDLRWDPVPYPRIESKRHPRLGMVS